MDADDFTVGDVIWLDFSDETYTSQKGEVVGVDPEFAEIDVQLGSVGYKSASNTEENFLIDLVTVSFHGDVPNAHGETINQNTEGMGRVSISHTDS